MKSIKLDQKLYEYFLGIGIREQPILQAIRQYAMGHPRFQMLSTIDSGQLLQRLIQLSQAKNILEIGTFVGYSAAAMALVLPEEGSITTCELRQEYADIAQGFWCEAGLQDKIVCKVGSALKHMEKMQDQSFDFIFIDADKSAYIDYYEQGLRLVRKAGFIIIDNTLFHGRVADQAENSSGVQAIRELNLIIKNDARVDMLMLTVGDGMTLVIKH